MRLDLNVVRQQAEIVITVACTLIGEEKRAGGCLRINSLNGDLNFFGKIGSIADPEKHEKYLVFASEKAARLASHLDHHTSFRSKNEALSQYQGAIRAGNFIFSFSGLPAAWDEACMAVLARLLDQLTYQDLDAILAESNNEFVQVLWEKIHEN